MSLRKISFQAKLILGTLAVVLIVIAAMSGASSFIVQDSMHKLARLSMKSFGDTVYGTMEMQYNLLSEKVKSDLSVMDIEIAGLGAPTLNNDKMIDMTIVNQVTKQSENVRIPAMQFGEKIINGNFDVVDAVQSKVGGTATIFQLLPGKLLRISTNVMKKDGQRAVGTYIPDSSVVYKTIMQGQTYYGIAYVVNAWYQTAYRPLLDENNEIIGVLYVGRKIMTPAFRKAIESAKSGGAGYGFIFNANSEIMLHPSIEGKKLDTFPFWTLFKNEKDGLVEYAYQGNDKVVYLRYFEPWQWTYGFSMNTSDMSHGVEESLLRWNLVLELVAALIIGIALFLMIKIVIKPLRSLASFAGEVAKGNYNAEIEYDIDDTIGNTINAVRDMTHEIKQKLGFSQGLLNGMTIPCVVVDLDEKITFINQEELDLLDKKGSPEDYIGQSLGQFLYGNASKTTGLKECMRRNENMLGIETSGTTDRGREYHIVVDMAPLRDLDGNTIGGFTLIKDMTTIKQSEQQVKLQHETMLETARDADSIAEQLSSAAEQLAAQVDQSSRGTEVQRNRAAETATAMEEMNATVFEVARNASDASNNAEMARDKAHEGAQIVAQVVDAIGQVEQRSLELKDSMTNLGKQADAIGAIMQVIEDIADQTNLLALNAAIEAARAGEAGRGFAVVADEVRKLAEKTMDATKQVGQAIGDIQDGARKNISATDLASKSIVQSTELAAQAGAAMEEIQHMVEQSADQVRNIATAAEEQSATSEEVNRATDEINVISSETAIAMQESAKAIESLTILADQLKQLIERMQ